MEILKFPSDPSRSNTGEMVTLKRILHVDDDDDIRTIVQLALEVVGEFKLDQFPDGASALEAAPLVDPDLLLLDVMMPGMSGQELWEKLRDEKGMEDTPVIFVTAKAEDEFSQLLVDRGALAVITKPFDPIELPKELLRIWNEQR